MITAAEPVVRLDDQPPRPTAAPPLPDNRSDPPRARHNLRSHLARGTGRLFALLAVDLGAIGLSRLLLRSVRSGVFGGTGAAWSNQLLPSGAVSSAQLSVAIAASLFLRGCYRDGDHWRDPAKILSASALGVVIALYADVWHGSGMVVASRGLLVWLSLGPILVLGRSLAHSATSRWRGTTLQRRVLEVTGGEMEGSPIWLGPSYRVIASMDQQDIPSDVQTMEGWLDGGVDTIVVRGDIPGTRFRFLTDFALTHSCRLLCAPYSAQLPGVEKKRVWVQGHPLVELTTPALRASHLVLKRALDVCVATLALILLGPLLLTIAVWIKLDSSGPVLFRQSRPGILGRPFGMLKFRSMRTDAEDFLVGNAALHERFLGNGCKLPEDEDPRITRVGRFLRRRSLDELPQLLNVLWGDMSLVGPRPLVGPEIDNYAGRVPVLLSVKPGMTGLWQVSGRSAVPFPERAEMDLEYVRNWSFVGDLWILILTPIVVLAGQGAH